jgi:hypothetical protein
MLDTRASDGDIGRLVSDAFAEERKGILAIVERQLSLPARSAADASAVAKLPLVASETGPNSIQPPAGPWTPVSPSNAPPTIAGTSTSVPLDVPAFRTSKRVVVLVASAGVIIIGAVIAIATVLGKTTPLPSHASATASSQPPAPSVTAAPVETTVDVAIEVVPARAKILIDGKNVGKSPFRAAVQKDTAPHEIVASADGYSTETRAIGFDRDVRVELSLRPVALGGRVTTSAPATSGGSAGSDLQVTRPKHNIDEKDPY